MQIDWVTVSAQIVNFLILVYLLKRFLYRPVVEAMDRREGRIRERLESADRREHDAQRQAAMYEEQREALEARQQVALAEARREAEHERERLLEDARRDVADQRRRWEEGLEREREEFLARLERVVANAGARIAERLISDLADVDVNERAVHVFLARLEQADEKTRAGLDKAAAQPLSVATPHRLSKTIRKEVGDRLRALLGRPVDVDFSESKDLVLGVVLSTPGWRMAWTVSDYVDAVTDRLESELAEPARRQA